MQRTLEIRNHADTVAAFTEFLRKNRDAALAESGPRSRPLPGQGANVNRHPPVKFAPAPNPGSR